MSNRDNKLVARASTTVDAPISRVWRALTDPDIIEQYMFGTQVVTDWREGSPITWQGEWQGKSYEDKGTILKIERPHLLEYTHFSPLTGEPDVPENYHRVTVELSGEGDRTKVSLSQDNNADEEARGHSEENWNMMLQNLKKTVESMDGERA